MKCPKCGYLGFETTDRCRNCQYDFSLAPFAGNEPELTLQDTTKADLTGDFDLPPIKRQSARLSATSLDLDRLFGEPDATSSPSSSRRAAEPSTDVIEFEGPPQRIEEIPDLEAAISLAQPEPALEPAADFVSEGSEPI